MSADPQSSIDERNRTFWDELCGTGLASSLGITEITPASLARFDEAYMAYYPYLARYLRLLPVESREVLEVGLGFGTVGQILAARGSNYHGADIAAGPVAMLRDRLRWLGRPTRELSSRHRRSSFPGRTKRSTSSCRSAACTTPVTCRAP